MEESKSLYLNLRVRLCLLLFVITLLTFVSRHYLLDDSLIYYRYIRNALGGNGLVFNTGEPVNALTSPVYTYTLLLGSYIFHGHIQLAASVIFAITLFVAGVLAENLAPYAGIFIASTSYLYHTVGMETSLLLMLIVLSITLLLTRRLTWVPLILVLMLLTRAEAGAMIPVAIWYMYRTKCWPRAASFIAPILVIFLHIGINHYVYGSYLPSSSSAKLGQARSGYWGTWPTAFLQIMPLRETMRHAPYTLPFLFVAGLWGFVQLKGSLRNAIVIPFISILLVFYVGFNIPHYHWYYAPFVFILALYAVVPMIKQKKLEALLLVLVAAQFITAGIVLREPDPRDEEYGRVMRWLDIHATPTASLEAAEIGVVGWDSHRRIIDILGLTEPKNADHIAHQDVVSWLAEDRPDYILMHNKPWIFERVALDSLDYERISFPDNDVFLLRRRGLVDQVNNHP